MKGASWKQTRNPCKRCTCAPCQCDPHVARRAQAQDRYDARKVASSPKSKPKKETKSSAPSMSKSKFIKGLRENNPSISDGEIKRALKKAGYSVGCGVVALIILSPLGWGLYEIVRAVI